MAVEYLKVTGRDRELGQLETNIAIGVARALADQYVTDMLTPDSMFALLGEQTAPLAQPGGLSTPRLEGPNFKNLSTIIRNVEYAGHWFYLTVPLNAGPEKGYRLQMRLSAWTWKLAGLDLPQDVRTRIANELVARSGLPSRR